MFYLLATLVVGLLASVLLAPKHYFSTFRTTRPGPQVVQSPPEWQPFHQLGGYDPWFQKTVGVVESGIEVPPGCHVDQVHMISRHAERYPNSVPGVRMLELYHRIKRSNVTFDGHLSFVNEWEFLTLDPTLHFENLLTTGPNAGTVQAFNTGVKLRTRYHDLLNGAIARGQTTYWAADSARVIESAKYFGAGFFGLDEKQSARLEIISEGAEMGGNTLTPGRSCRNYIENEDDHGHGLGASKFLEFRSIYIPQIISRLSKKHTGFTFTESEVYSMQELCGFETLVRGNSSWCKIFSKFEMDNFEYARDLLHFYKTGPGNPYAPTLGWLWLNATANLLRAGSVEGALFLSFVHDGDIIPLITALGLFHDGSALPVTHIRHDRKWRMSDVVPMGGRLIFERLACRSEPACWSDSPMYPNHIYCEPSRADDIFVRLNVNDGIVALPNCTSGPGASCPLDDFLTRVKDRGRTIPEFRELCGLDEQAKPGITFLQQQYESR